MEFENDEHFESENKNEVENENDAEKAGMKEARQQRDENEVRMAMRSRLMKIGERVMMMLRSIIVSGKPPSFKPSSSQARADHITENIQIK